MVKEITETFVMKVKKAFHTEDVFWENEIESNRLVAQGLINLSLVLVLTLVLNLVGIFELDAGAIYPLLIRGILELLIPVVIFHWCKGEKRWLKYLMIFEMIVVLARLDAVLTFSMILMMMAPVVFSVRYFSKKFTLEVAGLTAVLFALAEFCSVYLGVAMRADMNYVDSVVRGQTLEVGERLYAAVAPMVTDRLDLAVRYLARAYTPRLLMFAVLSICCAELARCGREMVLKQAKVSGEAARIEGELTLASQIQTGMLPCIFPAFPEHEEVDIYATMNPAKEVGGDFYDYFRIDDDHIAVVMADVSGKGVPAALFMMIGKTLIKNWTQSGKTAADVFTTVNAQLCENNEADLFITAWLGILEISTGKLTFCNAGHNPPLLRRTNGEFEFVKDRHGMVLAGIDCSCYKQSEIMLEAGDELYLYTDGVTEATNGAEELYGEDRLVQYLNGTDRSMPPKELLKELKADIDAFVGGAPQFDDITMLMLRLKEEM